MTAHILLYVLAAALIVIGFAGTVIPALPGPPLVFAGMLLAAWTDGFQHVGIWTLLVLGVLALLALLVDFVAGVAGAKRIGASRRALFGAVIGTVVGMFFGLPGIVVGPFLGALIGELSAGAHVHRATRVGVAAWIGFVLGAVLKIALCFTMLGIFVLAFVVG